MRFSGWSMRSYLRCGGRRKNGFGGFLRRSFDCLGMKELLETVKTLLQKNRLRSPSKIYFEHLVFLFFQFSNCPAGVIMS
jgi:hypothetical protein